MNPTLLALLIATGHSVNGFRVYVPRDGADPEEIKTQALAAGFVARAAEAEVRASPEGIAWLADAGISSTTYARIQFPIAVGSFAPVGEACVILPALPYRKIQLVKWEFDVTACATRPGVCQLYGDARPFRPVPHLCAWKPSAGAACVRVNPDGGPVVVRFSDGGLTANPGVQATMGPGEWSGAGCVRKSCAEFAGTSSSP